MFRADWAMLPGCHSSSQREPLNDASAARLRAEQFIAVRRLTPGMMLANAYNSLVFVVAFWGTPRFAHALYWAALLLSIVGYIYLRPRLGRWSAARRSPPMRRAIFNSLALGFCWAALPLFFFPDAAPGTQLLVACLSAGMLCGGAFALASIPCAALAFAGPVALASFIVLVRSGDMHHLLVAEVLVVYTLVLFRGVRAYAEQLRTRVLTQIEAEQSARRDTLTSLPNRLSFQEAIEKEFARIVRMKDGFLLICVDLDGFKLVNDKLGHLAGDELLRLAANRMQARLRPSELVARLGGDEFVVLAPEISTRTDAELIARRILDCFQDQFSIEGVELRCAASLGLAIAPRDGEDPHALLRSAEVALYRAKQEGGSFIFSS